LFKAGHLPNGIFSFYLTDDLNSEITFGGYKKEQVASAIVWAPVTRESYWQVSVDDITFNNEPSGLCQGDSAGSSGSCQVAVDTGTSMLAGPSHLIEALRDKLGAADDCSNFDQLPRIGFKVGNKVLNMAPEDYMDKEGGSCSFSVMNIDVPPPKGPLFIIGDPFLRRFVTIYDKKGPRVGFAVAKHNDMDAAGAAQIISNVQGEAPAAGVKDLEMSSNTVVMKLESGMMDEAPQQEPEQRIERAVKQNMKKRDTDQDWPFGSNGNDEDAMGDNDGDTKGSLLQTGHHALRGHRGLVPVSELEPLVSVRLHRSDKHIF